jgi:hypothetical protein
MRTLYTYVWSLKLEMHVVFLTNQMTQINITLWYFNVEGGRSERILLCALLVTVDRVRDRLNVLLAVHRSISV